MIILEAGDAVPADARIIESASLKIEEAALTGESVPVNKFIDIINLKDTEKDVPLGDRKNMMYMGSSVVYGRGRAVVTATGMDTEMGKIAGALAQAQDGQTPLQKKLAQLSKILSFIVIGICAVIFAIGIIRELVTGNQIGLEFLLDTFMIAVSLAVAQSPRVLRRLLLLYFQSALPICQRKTLLSESLPLLKHWAVRRLSVRIRRVLLHRTR